MATLFAPPLPPPMPLLRQIPELPDNPFLSVSLFDPPSEELPPPPIETEDTSGILRLTPDQESRLLQQLRRHYDEAIQARSELTTRREIRHRRFLADKSLRAGMQSWDEAQPFFTSLTRSTLETLKDELVQAIGTSENISALGIGEEDVQNADRLTQFVRHVLTEVNPTPWEDLIDFGIHDALQDALGLYKIYPYKEPFPQPMSNGQLLETIIRWDRVDEGTMLLPPDHTGFQWPECAYIGQQLWTPLDEFPSMRERGFTLPDIGGIRGAVGTGRQYTDDERNLLEFTRQGMQPDIANATYDPRVEMVESYELFALEPGQPRVFLVIHWFPHLRNTSTLVSSGQIARCMYLRDAMRQEAFPRPMWPFCPLTLWALPGQARGMSLVDKLESAQDLENQLTEQMVENGQISILPFVFANLALSGDLPNLRRIKPGDVVPLDNMGAVHFSPQNSNNRHYLEQMHVPRQWSEQDSGVTAFQQGRNPEQPNISRTLGGMALMLQQGQKGFKKQTYHVARQLRHALKLYVGLWQGHVRPSMRFVAPDTAGLTARLFAGGPAEQLTQVEIGEAQWQLQFDVRLRVNPEAHLEQQKRLMLAEKLDGIIAPVWPLGRRELWKDLWETMGLQQFDKFYPEAVATVQTQLLALQAQLQLAQLESLLMQASMPALPGQGAGQPGAEGGGQDVSPFAAMLQALGSGATGGATGAGENTAMPGPQSPAMMGMGG